MTISRLDLYHLRNLKQASIEPGTRFNFIVGDNGSGKSSLLEAIYLLGAGRSFRTSRYQHVIQHGEADFSLFAVANVNGRKHKVGYQRQRNGEMTIRLNGESVPRLADMVAKFPLQMLTPESAELLVGGNKGRRQFLDWGLFHQRSDYLVIWKQFERVLRQRNAALRKQLPLEMLAAWQGQFVDLSERLSALRADYCNQLASEFNSFCRIFLDSEFDIGYLPGWDQAQPLAALLELGYEKDRKSGFTNVGPHRGGFRIRQNGIPVETSCSRGQLKLLVAALRLAQGQILSDKVGRACLYLIDDFAAELDESHRALLIECLVAIKSQVFITATDMAFVSQVLPAIEEKGKSYKVFHVEQGQISELKE